MFFIIFLPLPLPSFPLLFLKIVFYSRFSTSKHSLCACDSEKKKNNNKATINVETNIENVNKITRSDIIYFLIFHVG